MSNGVLLEANHHCAIFSKDTMSIISNDCDETRWDLTYFCRAKCIPRWNIEVGSCPQKKYNDTGLGPRSWTYYRYDEMNLLSKTIMNYPIIRNWPTCITATAGTCIF